MDTNFCQWGHFGIGAFHKLFTGHRGGYKMPTMADKGGRKVQKMLTLADKGEGGEANADKRGKGSGY